MVLASRMIFFAGSEALTKVRRPKLLGPKSVFSILEWVGWVRLPRIEGLPVILRAALRVAFRLRLVRRSSMRSSGPRCFAGPKVMIVWPLSTSSRMDCMVAFMVSQILLPSKMLRTLPMRGEESTSLFSRTSSPSNCSSLMDA